jgi:translation initiation factor 2-alpha kinase 4
MDFDAPGSAESDPIEGDPVSGSRFLFMQMEFCPGRSLDECFRNRSFFDNPSAQWRIAGDVLQGLTYLHEHSVIHRDIKPSNIFIDASNHAKLGDFGLSKLPKVDSVPSKPPKVDSVPSKLPTVDSVPSPPPEPASRFEFEDPREMEQEFGHSIQGSFPYIAPEVVDHQQYDTASDMFSFGIVLFEVFYRFGTQSERAKTLKALLDQNAFPGDFKDQVAKSLIQQLVDRRPDARPSARDALKRAERERQYASQDLSLEDIKDVVGALSRGDIRQTPAVLAVLEVLFKHANEKRPPAEPETSRDEFLGEAPAVGRMMIAFLELLRTFGAVRFAAPIIGHYVNDGAGQPPLLGRSSALWVLKGCPWLFLVKEILKNGLKFARYGQWGSIFEGTIERMAVTYDVVNAGGDELDAIECLQFVAEFLARVGGASLRVEALEALIAPAAELGIFEECRLGGPWEKGVMAVVWAGPVKVASVGVMAREAYERLRKAESSVPELVPLITSASIEYEAVFELARK